ncbi:hypothetical protein CJ231_10535 [Hoylesella buccalis]|uniref:Uncharacterized protein n=1 Tax=Hoylesella buccalis TaxID=28127 RepID=A0A2N6QP63_9BACT|nr:hypothetical protein CJ231_10535 [Hoylesella buccalis]
MSTSASVPPRGISQSSSSMSSNSSSSSSSKSSKSSLIMKSKSSPSVFRSVGRYLLASSSLSTTSRCWPSFPNSYSISGTSSVSSSSIYFVNAKLLSGFMPPSSAKSMAPYIQL